jgi:SAM-dependent methyltransferase
MAWERGCQADALRNEFIVPSVIRFLQQDMPGRILDVGAGTAYIPRAVDRQLSYRPQWTVLDLNAHRIALARTLKPAEMLLEWLQADITKRLPPSEPYHAALLTFTLLEFSQLGQVLKNVADVITRDGLLILALPDVWRDALRHAAEGSRFAAALLEGQAEIPKIDKFTGKEYPFHAHRIEQIISVVLQLDFSLEALEQGGPSGEAFLLLFRKRSDAQVLAGLESV